MKKVTPEMRKKLVEIAVQNNFLDGGKKTKVFRQMMYRFGPEVHKYLVQINEEYRQVFW